MRERCYTGWIFVLMLAFGTWTAQGAPGVVKVTKLKDASIDESSGLAASKRYPGIYWTHNDQGHSPVLFAVNRQGKTLAKFKVTGPNIDDWEDIAVDKAGNLYIADTGNNNGKRDKVAIHLVKEPSPKGSASVKIQKTWKLETPAGGNFNGEAFFILNGWCYLIGKDLENNGAPVYRFPLSASGTIRPQRIGSLKVANRVTGACISADGSSLALVTENGVYVYTINGNALRALLAKPFYTAYDDTTMEGGTFAGDGFLVSSEQGDLFLFNQPAFRKK